MSINELLKAYGNLDPKTTLAISRFGSEKIVWKGTAESFYNEMKFVYENVYVFYIDTDGLRVILW